MSEITLTLNIPNRIVVDVVIPGVNTGSVCPTLNELLVSTSASLIYTGLEAASKTGPVVDLIPPVDLRAFIEAAQLIYLLANLTSLERNEVVPYLDEDNLDLLSTLQLNYITGLLLGTQVQLLTNGQLDNLTTGQKNGIVPDLTNSNLDLLIEAQLSYIVTLLTAVQIVLLTNAQLDSLTSAQLTGIVAQLLATHVQLLSATQIGYILNSQLLNVTTSQKNYLITIMGSGQMNLIDSAQANYLDSTRINYFDTTRMNLFDSTRIQYLDQTRVQYLSNAQLRTLSQLQRKQVIYRDLSDYSLTLPNGAVNNFGNTQRFTDTLGIQTYANNIIIDHLFNLYIYRVLFATGNNWTTSNASITTLNTGGISGWRMPNQYEIFNLASSASSATFNYAPLNLAPANGIWTSNSPAGGQHFYINGNAQRAPASDGTTIYNGLAVKTYIP